MDRKTRLIEIFQDTQRFDLVEFAIYCQDYETANYEAFKRLF